MISEPIEQVEDGKNGPSVSIDWTSADFQTEITGDEINWPFGFGC